MATVETPQGISGLSQWGVVLEGVSWETYEKLLQGIGERHVFVNYDRGVMEIQMSPGRKHEFGVGILRSLVTLVQALKGIPVESGGSTTHKRQDLDKGAEPDACYWIAHAQEMRGVTDLDLTKHPAPDLVIEVDVAASSVDRIEIFRKLGVREIWRVSDEGLEFLVLGEDEHYHPTEHSHSFPFIPRATVAKAVELEPSLGENAVLEMLMTDLKLK